MDSTIIHPPHVVKGRENDLAEGYGTIWNDPSRPLPDDTNRIVYDDESHRGVMVVKSARGRRRYIVFTVPKGVGRHDVLEALSPLGMDDLRVITSFDGKAVVRTSPSGIEKVRTAMADSFGSESLLTSGTLKTLRDRCPELRVQNNDPRIKRKKQAPGNNGA